MLRPNEIIVVNEELQNQERYRNQKYCFSWANYKGHMMDQMGELLREEKFVDVTIYCENRYFKAHKIILCGASPFLKEILEECPCKHPIITLANISWMHLTWILQFIYSGQVSIPEDNFAEFLETAKLLQISTLCKKTNVLKRPSISQVAAEEKRPRVEEPSVPVFFRTAELMQEMQHSSEVHQLEVQAEEVVEIEVCDQHQQDTSQDQTSTEPGFNPHDSYCIPGSTLAHAQSSEQPEGPSRPEAFLFESFHASTLKSTHSLAPKTCNMCGKIYSNLSNLRQHINLVHATPKSVRCPLCGKPFKSDLYMRRHLICSHNVTPVKKDSWRDRKVESTPTNSSIAEHHQNIQTNMWNEMNNAVANLAQSNG